MGLNYLLALRPYGHPLGQSVSVLWELATEASMSWNRVLYLYQKSDGSIYYIGKAYGQTVAQRRQDHADEGLITLGPFIPPSQRLTLMVGTLQAGQSITDSLVSDVEALLIREVQPSQNRVTPTVSRDNLEVTCTGTWPLAQTVFSNTAVSAFVRSLIGGRQ
jgi:hypothetical protein